MTMKITTEELQNIVNDLLDATHPLAESHPLPTHQSTFLRILEFTFRRNYFRLLAIHKLCMNKELADSALDITRSMLEDVISIEYMIAKGKKEMAEVFKDFLWVQMHQNLEFFKILGRDPKEIGMEVNEEEIEKNYQRVRPNFIHKPTGKDLRSWAGKEIEKMLEELQQLGSLGEFDISRTGMGYVFGNWKNHFNPYDVTGYMQQDIRNEGITLALGQSLVFSATCLYRLTTRYIDEIRYGANENLHEDVATKIKKIWERMNP